MLNTMDYNYKLISLLRQEDDSTTNKWTWFNKQVHDTFLYSWMISRALVNYTNTLRAIGCILVEVYALSMSMKDSIRSETSFLHTSIILHLGSDDHLHIHKFVYKGLFSSSLKKQKNGKVSLNNAIVGVDYKLTINMLMKQLYIAVRYLYITD